MKLKYVVFILLSLLLTCSNSFGQVENEKLPLFKKAITLYEAKKYEDAKIILMKLFRESPDSVDINFQLGLCADKMGDYENASMAYERILISNSELHRVRLELAKAYYKLGLFQMSLAEFKTVAGEKELPPSVSNNIEAFMARIKSLRKIGKTKHRLGGSITLSANFDDNARQSPGQEKIRLPKLPEPMTVKTVGDEYLASILVINHFYKTEMEKLLWNSSFIKFNTFYDEETDLKLDYYYGQSGPRLIFDNASLDLNILASYIGKDYDKYLDSYGLAATYTQKLDENFVLSLNAKIEDQSYIQEQRLDGFRYSLWVIPSAIFGNNMFTASASFENAATESKVESNNKYSASFRYTRLLFAKLSIFADYSFTRSLYDEPNLSYSIKRRQDDISQVTAGLRKVFGGSLIVEAKHSYKRSYSTVELNDYNKRLTTISVSYLF